MAAILRGLIASPNKTWQPSWEADCLTQQNMAAILVGLFATPNKTWQPSWEADYLTQQNMANHSANQIARNKCFVTLSNASCKFLVCDIRKATFVYNLELEILF